MNQQLKLTARGQAVCELMADLGLSLDAACAEVEREVEALRRKVDNILTQGAWEDMPRAVRDALNGVSLPVQNVYLEESAHSASEPIHGAPSEHGARIH